MDIGYDNVEPKALEQVLDQEFEELCHRLIRRECERRQLALGDVDIDGPRGRYKGDGGRDVRVCLRNLPRIAATHNDLIPDEIGEHYFSCKSGKNWEEDVLCDLRSQSRPMEILDAGGHYTILVNRIVQKEELEKGSPPRGPKAGTRKASVGGAGKGSRGGTRRKVPLRQRLGQLFQEEWPHRDASALDRIRIVGAHELCALLRTHRPSLPKRIREILGIDDAGELLSLAEWESQHRGERDLPLFCADSPRQAALGQLADFIARAIDDPALQALWIYGPPGVGKTRLVMEALRGHPDTYDIEARVLVARQQAVGMEAITTHRLFQRYNDLVLVVDECTAAGAVDLFSEFAARQGGGSGRLIMIGPMPHPGAQPRMRVQPLPLAPLEDNAGRALIAQELGLAIPQPDAVDVIWKLSEGYPWYAVLLAQAAHHEPDALSNGSTHWDAAQHALARRWDFGSNETAWGHEALNRARALLAVLLTEDVSWEALAVHQRDDLARAVGLESFAQLQGLADGCYERGLVRRSPHWELKYVTPDILAREILNRLLPERGPELRRYVPDWAAKLYRRLAYYQVPDAVARSLALAELRAAEQEGFSLDAVGQRALVLPFYARWAPGPTSRWLRRLVEAVPSQELMQRSDLRDTLSFALASLTRRRHGVVDAEAALFRLAQAEGESGPARRVWQNLFQLDLSATYLSVLERLALLERRLQEGSIEERLVALRGLTSAMAREPALYRYDDDEQEGPWPVASEADLTEGLKRAWRILVDLAVDADASVAQAARRLTVHKLRSAVRAGLAKEVLLHLGQTVDTWGPQEHEALRGVLDETAQYDGPWFDEAVQAVLQELRERLAPRSFSERLHHAVGQWRPWRGQAASLDTHDPWGAAQARLLAEEGLASPELFLSELDWLESEAAVRSVAFMRTVGSVDTARLLLPRLMDRACRYSIQPGLPAPAYARMLLPPYLGGMASAGCSDEVDELLQRWHGDPSMALASLLAIWHAGATARRVDWIVDDLYAGRLDSAPLDCLVTASWNRPLDEGSLLKLVSAVSALPGVHTQWVALELVLARLEPPPQWQQSAAHAPLRQALWPTLVLAVQRLAAASKLDPTMAYSWERGCRQLLTDGETERVLAAALTALRNPHRMGPDEHAWNIVEERLKVEPASTWPRLASLLEEPALRPSEIWAELGSRRIVKSLPVDVVLAWVGRDERRGRLAAELATAHELPLETLTRSLIIRFGPDSLVARVLASRAHSTLGAFIGGLSGFFRDQVEKARGWTADSDPRIAAWGRDVLASLRRKLDAHLELEAYERRRRGA